MTKRTMKHWGMMATLGMASLATMGAGCGPGPTGDYSTYRIAASPVMKTLGCYQDNMIPPNMREDTTTFLTGGELTMYGGPGDTQFLQVGNAVMMGTKSGSTYTFTGQTVNVEFLGIGGTDPKLTTTTTNTTTVELQGDDVKGTNTAATTSSCPNCPNFTAMDCTQTSSFQGTRVFDNRAISP